MTVLSVAVVILAIAVAVDLVLSAAIIRRLREIQQQGPAGPGGTGGLAIGTPLPLAAIERSAARTGLTPEDLTGAPVLLAFFSTTCRYCPEEADRLVARADRLAAEGVRVVSVVTTEGGAGVPELATVLDRAGRVVVESGPAELAPLFEVLGTPSYLHFDENGRVAATGFTIDDAMPVAHS